MPKAKSKPRRRTRAAATPWLDDEPLARLRRNGDAPVPARALAELCGVDLKTVHQWATSGLIAHFRTPGRHLRFRSDEVLRFLERSGYPRGARRATRLLVLLPRAAKPGARALSGHDVAWLKDPYAALVEAARRDVAVIVLYAEALATVDAKPYVAALSSAAPGARIDVLGAERRQRLAGVRGIARLEQALEEP